MGISSRFAPQMTCKQIERYFQYDSSCVALSTVVVITSQFALTFALSFSMA